MLRERRKRTELGLRDEELFRRGALGASRATLLEDLLLEELFEALAQLALVDGRSAFHRLDRALEAVDRRELQQTVRLRLALERLIQVRRVHLALIRKRKQAEAHGSLEQDQHHFSRRCLHVAVKTNRARGQNFLRPGSAGSSRDPSLPRAVRALSTMQSLRPVLRSAPIAARIAARAPAVSVARVAVANAQPTLSRSISTSSVVCKEDRSWVDKGPITYEELKPYTEAPSGVCTDANAENRHHRCP